MPPRIDTRGVFRDGWTPEDVAAVSQALEPEIGWRLVCAWEACDTFGPHGDSNIGFLRPIVSDGSVQAVSAEMWAHLVDGAPPPRGFPISGEIIAAYVEDDGWHMHDRWNYYRRIT